MLLVRQLTARGNAGMAWLLLLLLLLLLTLLLMLPALDLVLTELVALVRVMLHDALL
jgi:hypothetical protein